MGCPVGIGPEIILRYFSEQRRKQQPRLVVLGDRGVLERTARELAIPVTCHEFLPEKPIETLEPGSVPVLQVSSLKPDELQWGKPTPSTGEAMANYIFAAVELALARKISAIVTCPISKTSLNNAGHHFPGHTEMLASLTKAQEHAMMLAGDKLRVTLVTIHNSLQDVPRLLSRAKVADLIRITHESLKNDFGIAFPRLAVAGLNPHAGEDGLFGDEEVTVIQPAVQQSRQAGIEVSGPYPPDTVFYKAASGQFDAVVCMYHDQGLIPFKLLHFEDGVNVTLGLPIVRTSVDHGTAYDIAGQGRATPQSLAAAINLAAHIAHNRRQKQ